MTTLAQAIAALVPADGGWRGTVPDNWLQGRTAYGGFSAALALVAAKRCEPDLPPLRSAQVAFIGPLSGAITVRAERLRRGRNAAFIQADVASEAGLGLRAIFVFMRDQPSAIDRAVGTAPPFPAPREDEAVQVDSQAAFIGNFDLIDRRPDRIGDAEWLRWVRLRDRDGLDPVVEMMAMADCLPPAAMRLLRRHVPISSLTWQLNLLDPAPATDNGWWLLRATTDYARGGSSSQAMGVWNAAGTPIADQTQSVALFG